MKLSSKMLGVLWLGLAAMSVPLVTLSIPYLARKVPWSWEKKLAAQLPQVIDLRTCHQEEGRVALTHLLSRLQEGPALILPYPVHVQVLEGSTENAFASLGGEIYVYQGLLKTLKSPDELAAVLAHEIEHVQRRHIAVAAFSHLFSYGLLSFILSGDSSKAIEVLHSLSNLSFSRVQESEADEGGLKRLQLAHIDSQGFAHFFERLSTSENPIPYLSDHPSSQSRAEKIKAFPSLNSSPSLSPTDWLQLTKICLIAP